MPKFLAPIFILSLVFLSGFLYVVLKLDPEQTPSVVLFLVTLFLSLTFILSLLFFFIHKKFFFKPKTFAALGPVVIAEDLRPLFRTSFRNAALLAALLTILLIFQRFL